jgi:hypothetical protein
VRGISRQLCVIVGSVVVALIAVGATGARTSSALRLTGMREDPNRPGLLRLVIGFSGTGLRANRVTAAVRPASQDATKLASASLTLSDVTLGHVSVLTTRDGTIVSASQRGANTRVAISPKPGRYKYLSYKLADRRHIVLLLWRSATPAAPAASVHGVPPGCIAFDHTHRVTGRITAFGRARGAFENQFMLALRDGKGHRFTRTTIHVASDGTWSGSLTYHVSRVQWGTLEAVEFSAKDASIGCIAQFAVKLQAQ